MKTPNSTSDTADQAQDNANGLLDQATAAANQAKAKANELFAQAGAATDQAKAKAQELLDQMPGAAQEARDKTVSALKSLSTAQKVMGGALLAAGLAYLIAPKKAGKAKRKAAALDQLLLFVNDRAAGYKRAAAETKDGDLRSYYQYLVGQSQQFAAKLNAYLTREGAPRETGTTLKGKLYRKLMDAQAVVTGRDEKAILTANIYGERWALKAYKQALRRQALKGDIRNVVLNQFAQSKKTYKKLKELAARH